MTSLIEHHRDQIEGMLSCFDRVLIQGTLPSVCHARAMADTLDRRSIRLFDSRRSSRSRSGRRFARTPSVLPPRKDLSLSRVHLGAEGLP
jgi:hypothetical protein